MSKLPFILLTLLLACSDSKEYRIQFDNIDELDKQIPIYIKGLKVGKVNNIEFDNNKHVLVTIEIDRYIKLTKDSKCILHSELMGGKSIEIVLTDNNEPVDQDQILIGLIEPLDKTGLKEISEHELDNLARLNPEYKMTDTIVKILKKVKEESGHKK